jgi:hypothetical protein
LEGLGSLHRDRHTARQERPVGDPAPATKEAVRSSVCSWIRTCAQNAIVIATQQRKQISL